MFQIGTTRFNNITYDENKTYRTTHNERVIYTTNIRINCKCPPGMLIFVVEMNNETNKIEGIGLIKHKLCCDKKYKIYSCNDYNRFCYKGKYWLGRDQIASIDEELVNTFDKILFKGKSHLKRQSGISMVTEKVLDHWNVELNVLKRKLKNMFICTFNNVNEERNNNLNINTTNI